MVCLGLPVEGTQDKKGEGSTTFLFLSTILLTSGYNVRTQRPRGRLKGGNSECMLGDSLVNIKSQGGSSAVAATAGCGLG